MKFLNFDPAAFLRDYWQKAPLLIRNPWDDWTNPLAPDELAGLACEDEVESRIITRRPKGLKLEHGPFPESRFAKLGKHPWTMLVQAVDVHAPQVAALIAPFRFVPDWRIDDVMVSYASDGGGVGPHFDQYDVFLIQGLGRRRWRIGQRCDGKTALLPHDDLRLLAEFALTDEWVLEPGDMLYLPPGVAHDGVAVGDDCMTYSIGFRAPARSELIAHWCDHLLAELGEDDRYADPDLAAQANPGEIAEEAIERLHAMITEKLADRAGFARWFGSYVSTPKYPELLNDVEAPMTADALREALASGARLERAPGSRLAFVRRANGLTLFADGTAFEVDQDTAALVEALCGDGRIVAGGPQTSAALALMSDLFNQGSVVFAEA